MQITCKIHIARGCIVQCICAAREDQLFCSFSSALLCVTKSTSYQLQQSITINAMQSLTASYPDSDCVKQFRARILLGFYRCAGCVSLLEAELASYAVMHVTHEQRLNHSFYCINIMRTSISSENFYIGGDETVPLLIPREQACGRWTLLGSLRTPNSFRYVRSVWHDCQFRRVWLHIWSRYVLSGEILAHELMTEYDRMSLHQITNIGCQGLEFSSTIVPMISMCSNWCCKFWHSICRNELRRYYSKWPRC